MIEVVDASVAVKWFIRSQETGLDAADTVRRRIIQDPDQFAVPTLFIYEVQATLCRRFQEASHVDRAMASLWALAIPVVVPNQFLLDATSHLAFHCHLTGYDAAYAGLARHLGGVWITFDRAAAQRVVPTTLVRYL